MRRIIGQSTRIKSGLPARLEQCTAHHIKVGTLVAHCVFRRGAQRCNGHGGGLGTGKARTLARLTGQRLHDRGQLGMLAVVQMVRLGRGKEDFLHPFAAQKT